jgi:hypothetical protein
LSAPQNDDLALEAHMMEANERVLIARNRPGDQT